MLMAYEDLGFKIEDIPTGDTRVPLHPIDSYTDARRIYEEACRQRSDVRWEIVGKGPYGVHEKHPANMTTEELKSQLIRDIDQMYLDKTITEKSYRNFAVFANASYGSELKRASDRNAAETLNLEEMVVKRMAELRAKPIMD